MTVKYSITSGGNRSYHSPANRVNLWTNTALGFFPKKGIPVHRPADRRTRSIRWIREGILCYIFDRAYRTAGEEKT